MKPNLLFGIISLLVVFSCKDDDNTTPNELIIAAFNAKYPTASNVEWETQNSYLTADFIDSQLSHTAWFSSNGQWHMTETELNRLDLLPEKVLTAFRNSEYATWTTDDIDRLERLDAEALYVIEVKKEHQEYDLYYSPDGILIKTLADNQDNGYENELPSSMSSAITDFIDSKYPGARLIEIEAEHGQIEADILHENRKKEVIFTSGNEWLHTHYDILKNDVQEIVIQALNASAYATFIVDDIEKYETPAGDYYYFELEKGPAEVKLKIDMNGNINIIKG